MEVSNAVLGVKNDLMESDKLEFRGDNKPVIYTSADQISARSNDPAIL